MLVKEVMTSPALTVSADTTVKHALRLLDERGVTSFPVVDDQNRIVGVVSEADLLRDAVRHDPRTHMMAPVDDEEHPGRVGDVMTVKAITVTADSDLSDAVAVMTSTAVKSLPVIEGDRVVGVVSRRDVVHLLARDDELIRSEVYDLLRSAGLGCEVEVEDGIVKVVHLQDPAQRRAIEAVAGSVAGVISVHTVD